MQMLDSRGDTGNSNAGAQRSQGQSGAAQYQQSAHAQNAAAYPSSRQQQNNPAPQDMDAFDDDIPFN